MMSGEATPSQIAGFLIALRIRGETVEEITGAARIMREKALKVSAPDDAIDVVGTGGDGAGTLNISTATAIVVAGCGVPIAKHGNRAASSKSGAADVLSELGINLDADVPTVERAIREAGIGFLLAPAYHSSMRHVGPARVEMGVRTIFNILGPLANPRLSNDCLSEPSRVSGLNQWHKCSGTWERSGPGSCMAQTVLMN